MTEERIVHTQAPDGAEHTHTTIITEAPRSGGSGGKWFVIGMMLLLGVIGIFALMQASDAEIAKDNAVADAASEVGDAATSVGNAAQDAADSITQ